MAARAAGRSGVLATLFAIVLGGGLLAPATNAEPPPPDRPAAELHVDSQAYEGPRGTILAGLRGRCAPGFEFAELTLDFAQGDVVTPTGLGQPFPCDGRWHRQRVSSDEAFEPGRATLTARLTVLDSATGDPAPQAVTTKSIYVRPAAKVVLPRTAWLQPGGAVTMVLRARCDEPWLLQGFYVSGSQGTFPDQGQGDTQLDLTCDGLMHPVRASLTSVAAPFRRGPLLVDAEITLLDPEFFDPVAQARTSRTVRVR